MGFLRRGWNTPQQRHTAWMEVTVSEADRGRITRLETELAALRDKNNQGRVTKKE